MRCMSCMSRMNSSVPRFRYLQIGMCLYSRARGSSNFESGDSSTLYGPTIISHPENTDPPSMSLDSVFNSLQ